MSFGNNIRTAREFPRVARGCPFKRIFLTAGQEILSISRAGWSAKVAHASGQWNRIPEPWVFCFRWHGNGMWVVDCPWVKLHESQWMLRIWILIQARSSATLVCLLLGGFNSVVSVNIYSVHDDTLFYELVLPLIGCHTVPWTSGFPVHCFPLALDIQHQSPLPSTSRRLAWYSNRYWQS